MKYFILLTVRIVFNIDPDYVIFPYLEKSYVIATSRESFLFKTENESILFISLVRFNTSPPLTIKYSTNNENLPAAIVAKGYNRIFTGIDYRGERVTGHFCGVDISLTTEKNNNEYAVIKVSDTGIGIPEESQHLIFEEFRKASEGLSRKYEGSGLGLTITKKYITLLKGKINLKSKHGVGSEFSVRVPINLNLYYQNSDS